MSFWWDDRRRAGLPPRKSSPVACRRSSQLILVATTVSPSQKTVSSYFTASTQQFNLCISLSPSFLPASCLPLCQRHLILPLFHLNFVLSCDLLYTAHPQALAFVFLVCHWVNSKAIQQLPHQHRTSTTRTRASTSTYTYRHTYTYTYTNINISIIITSSSNSVGRGRRMASIELIVKFTRVILAIVILSSCSNCQGRELTKKTFNQLVGSNVNLFVNFYSPRLVGLLLLLMCESEIVSHLSRWIVCHLNIFWNELQNV